MTASNQVQQTIQTKLDQEFKPQLLEVVNESYMHNVPPGSETHFKIVVVSDAFSGKRSVARHQMIYQALAEEVAGPVHALAIHTFTGDEWQVGGQTSASSPQCLGGSKADKH